MQCRLTIPPYPNSLPEGAGTGWARDACYGLSLMTPDPTARSSSAVAAAIDLRTASWCDLRLTPMGLTDNVPPENLPRRSSGESGEPSPHPAREPVATDLQHPAVLRSSLPVAKRPTGATKTWANRARALIGLLVIAPFAVAAIGSPPLLTPNSWWAGICVSLGWLVFLTGAGMRIWATLYIGGRKGHAVIDEGPYSICRNPLYFGTFLIALSIALFVQSLTFGVGLALSAAAYLWATLPNEEGRLRKNLGESYAEYCRRVPRFIPRPWLHQTPATIEVSTRGLAREAGRALRWAWVPVLCQLAQIARAQPDWPRWFNLP